VRRIADFTSYRGVLPYASEIFGVYQPMLGWRSKRIQERVARGFANDLVDVQGRLLAGLVPRLVVEPEREHGRPRFAGLEPAVAEAVRPRGTDTFLGDAIAADLPPLEELDDRVWDRLLADDRLQGILAERSLPQTLEAEGMLEEATDGRERGPRPVAEQLVRESRLAGYLRFLREAGLHDRLRQLFYRDDLDPARMAQVLRAADPFELIDPQEDLQRVGVSPVGIVHLFRQYFFELDTFLGTPVGHVWLSPGSTVELVEVTTRRTLVERTTATATDTTIRSERSTTDQDEIADAVKEENRSDTRFGVNATVEQGWIGGSATATASLDLERTQTRARENSHRHMRQQTEKLSTEIRRNFTSTFRTVTETTDVSSKRHVLMNATDDLLNYELRRKMRQVGVQVQDIGTYLCWQTYVDDPGRQLGIAKLVHLAKDPEVGATPPPEAVPRPDDLTTRHEIDIPFIPATKDTEPDEDMDEVYIDGVEKNLDFNEGTPEKIRWQFDGFEASAGQAGYELARLAFDPSGNDIVLEAANVEEPTPGTVRYGLRVRHVNFKNNSPLRVGVDITWRPQKAVLDAVETENAARTDAFNEATKREFQKAFVTAARERIEAASAITARPSDDLREEERIVVYRSLVQGMLTKSLPMPDDRTRHAVSELLNAIFDIDKMLYFVAPEWWRPRLHRSQQSLGGVRNPDGTTTTTSDGPGTKAATPTTTPTLHALSTVEQFHVILATGLLGKLLTPKENDAVGATDTVSWGGVGEGRVDNYFITEDSQPARLGSSLGWLLQLDGDDHRNAFLNAPWVKAVIPIRPGQERAALNWLQQVGVEGVDGLDDDYQASPEEIEAIDPNGGPVTIRQALEHLCDRVAERHRAAWEVGEYPTEEINDDDRVSATPIDRVYEHGFYPLEGGFRITPGEEAFEVFDQWVEILPTDQVVPVEVRYDPETGRQV
jgi:hypothetical protein